MILDEQPLLRPAEGPRRLGRAALEVGRQVAGERHAADAPAAAAGPRLEHARADPILEKGLELRRAADDGAARDGHARVDREPAGGDLVTEDLERGRRRADEGQARVAHVPAEGRVLGEEAVARVHRVAALAQRRGDELVAVRVRRRAPQRRGGVAMVTQLLVLRRHSDDGRQRAVSRSACDARRDLAAICDEEALHAGCAVLRRFFALFCACPKFRAISSAQCAPPTGAHASRRVARRAARTATRGNALVVLNALRQKPQNRVPRRCHRG